MPINQSLLFAYKPTSPLDLSSYPRQQSAFVYGAEDCTLSDQRRRTAGWTRLVPAWEETKEQHERE
jgi:hypothetical protein